MNRATVSGETIVAGVVGRPARRSLSPAIHNAWIQAAGIDGMYLALSLDAGRFRAFAEGLRGGSVRGLNVTLPFKEEALAVADRASPRARVAGAANLLLFAADGAVEADNTDGLGLLDAINSAGGGVGGEVAVVAGAGGAARGAVAALLEAGVAEVRVANRTLARAEALAADLGPGVIPVAWADLEVALRGAGVLVNATSLGMDGGEAFVPPLDGMRPDGVVMDMVYRPLVTPLLAAARRRGLKAADGLAMLVGQARPAFERFFGQAPPPEVDARGVAMRQMERWA